MGADKRGMTQNARTGSKGAGDLAAPPPPRPAQWPTPQPARSVRTFLPLRPAGCARRDGETQREAGAWSKRRSLSLLISLFFKFQVWREASKDPGIFIFIFFPKMHPKRFLLGTGWGRRGPFHLRGKHRTRGARNVGVPGLPTVRSPPVSWTPVPRGAHECQRVLPWQRWPHCHWVAEMTTAAQCVKLRGVP